MLKKNYGILSTETIIFYPVKKYGVWTKQETVLIEPGKVIYSSENEEARDKSLEEILTKGYWNHFYQPDSTPLPTEKPELPKNIRELDCWNNGVVWMDPEHNTVYKDVHCILEREIYEDYSNKPYRRKNLPYQREIHTYTKVEFLRYEEDGENNDNGQ